jgi:acetyl esterase/lipase
MQRLSHISSACFIAVLCWPAFAVDADPPPATLFAGMKFDRDVAYGTKSDKQKLDILYPIDHSKPRPAVLYIHGGGWGGGDKADDPEMQMDMLNGFAKDGCVALSINYRLAAEAKFPAAVEDCKLAIRWLRAHAGDYGVDKSRIGVVGGSAGGHLAAMLAVTRKEDGLEGEGFLNESSAVQAAASVSGPTDLSVDMCASQIESRRKMVANFLGMPREKDPGHTRRASPIAYVRNDIPPMLIVHCKDDKSIDADQSIRFAEALTKAGAPAQLLLLDGSNHGSDMARTEPVLSDLRKLFRETLKPEATN